MSIPEELRKKLTDKGLRRLDIGSIVIHLGTGTIYREILIDGRTLGHIKFPDSTIDWEIITKAIEKRFKK